MSRCVCIFLSASKFCRDRSAWALSVASRPSFGAEQLAPAASGTHVRDNTKGMRSLSYA